MSFALDHLSQNYPSIVPLEKEDLSKAFILSTKIGWTDSTEDWKEAYNATSGSAFSLFSSNQMIGTALGVHYGDKTRIANVIIDPDYQGQGHGFRLFKHLIDHLSADNSPLIELGASLAGKPLYEKFGFKTRYEIQSFSKVISTSSDFKSNGMFCQEEDLESVIQLDEEAFGTSRANLIRNVFESAAHQILIDKQDEKTLGFLMWRQETDGIRIGPWIHQETEGAKRLVKMALHVLARNHPETKVTFHVTNQLAKDILIGEGFNYAFSSYHMTLGERVLSKNSTYYGIWSFAMG